MIYNTSIGIRKEERGRNKRGVSLSAKVAVLKFQHFDKVGDKVAQNGIRF